MKTSKNGYDLIKRFEGCELKAYVCPAGVLTIGYGHTLTAKAGQVITQEEADKLLEQDVVRCEETLKNACRVKLNQNQWDALISFIFNLGGIKFRNSTLLMVLNEGKYREVPHQLKRWDKATVKGKKESLPGLIKRRAAEAELFETKSDPICFT